MYKRMKHREDFIFQLQNIYLQLLSPYVTKINAVKNVTPR